MEALLPQPDTGRAPESGRGPSRVGGVRGALSRVAAAFVERLPAGSSHIMVRDEPDLERAAALPVIGTIPHFGPVEQRAGARPLPDGGATAAYVAVAAALRLCVGTGPRVVVLASARSGDGKTTTAANLAMTAARTGSRVLLVDGETRRGDQHAMFGVQSEPGLFDLLFGQADERDCIRAVSRAGATFDLLPSGGAAQSDAADLITAGALPLLLARLRERYDLIYVDSPPLDRFTDAARLGAYADAVLFVARAARTPQRSVEHAMSELRHVRANVVGALLNGATRR